MFVPVKAPLPRHNTIKGETTTYVSQNGSPFNSTISGIQGSRVPTDSLSRTWL